VSPKRRWTILGASALAAALTLCLTPLFGTTSLDMAQVWSGTGVHAEIFWSLRLPRVLLAALAGVALAASGATFQAVFRNDLATPYTLGIASGASLGAVTAIHLGLGGTLLGMGALPIAAFAGAGAVVLTVYGVSRSLGNKLDPATVLLTGVTISFLCSALILLMQYLSDFTGAHRMIRWMMGGLDTVGYGSLAYSTPFVMVGLVWILLRAPIFNHLLTGDLLAASRGIKVRRERLSALLAASLMTGAVIAFVGPIGFVGLIIPHAARRLVGADHRWLLPTSALMGAAFLPLCDAIARTLIAPAEIPVGVLTALLGAPFFLWILVRSR
jgi:iron complex transport system permease protein